MTVSLQEIPMSPTSKSYRMWKKSQINSNIYVFYWTNSEELLDKNYMPEFVDLGPHSFRYVTYDCL